MNFIFKKLTFTKQIRGLHQKLSFSMNILWKFVKILFKKNKKLKQKTLYFSNKNVFDKSIFTLTYDFENALYYELKGFHISLNGQSIELYNNNLLQKAEFIVHGFRKKETFTLDYQITKIIHSEKFEIKFLQSFKIEKLNINATFKPHYLKVSKFLFQTTTPKISVKKTKLKYNTTPYNSKDFI